MFKSIAKLYVSNKSKIKFDKKGICWNIKNIQRTSNWMISHSSCQPFPLLLCCRRSHVHKDSIRTAVSPSSLIWPKSRTIWSQQIHHALCYIFSLLIPSHVRVCMHCLVNSSESSWGFRMRSSLQIKQYNNRKNRLQLFF